MSSGNFKWLQIIFLVWIGSGLVTGCARRVSVPAPSAPPPSPTLPEIVTTPPTLPPPPQSAPQRAEKPGIPDERGGAEERPGPRAVASLQMTEQGRELLERKKVDDAIVVFERAVSLNPTNGQNYYYLAEAWLIKRNINQAEEFNYLADVHLEGNQTWMLKVKEQKRRIKNFSLIPQ